MNVANGPSARTRPRLRDRLRYRFDNSFAAGPGPIIGWLAAATIVFVTAAGIFLAISDTRLDGNRHGFVEGFWSSLMRALDPGVMGDDQGWRFRAVALLVTVAGLFVVSTLIGLIATGMHQRLDRLRKGRTPVIEDDHLLVLGWSPMLPAVLREILRAYQQESHRNAIVVLAPCDRVEMEEGLRTRVPVRFGTRIVCRTGDPADALDLAIVAPERARAIIVLRPDEPDADAQVTRAALALVNGPLRELPTPLVAELDDVRTADALEYATRGRVATVVARDVVARMTAQACHQPGITHVYRELLTFAGDDIRFAAVPELVGHTYADALLAFDRASLFGVRRASGDIVLAPHGDHRFEEGDAVIVIAASSTDIRFAGFKVADHLDPEFGQTLPARRGTTTHTLIAGWNHLGPIMLDELDRSMEPGSSVMIAVDPDHAEHEALAVVGTFGHLDVGVEKVDFGRPTEYQRLATGRAVDQLVVLCYHRDIAPPAADARALTTLLGLSRALDEAGGAPNGVAVEILDSKNVALVTADAADDFIVADEFAALVMAQFAMAIDVRRVLARILDTSDVNIELRPVTDFVPTGRELTYGFVVAVGRRAGQTIVGYRQPREAGTRSLRMNPHKNETVCFESGDELVVVTNPATEAGRSARGN